MINTRFYIGFMLIAILVGSVTPQVPVAATGVPTALSAVAPDDTAIREAAQSFVKCFNTGDAKAVAALWAENGEYVDETGKRYEGRAAIEKEYESFFTEFQGVQIQIEVDTVKMLSPESAVAEGTSTLGTAESPAAVSSHYLAIYVKKNNQWQIASAHDIRAVDNTDYGDLADLEGIVGTWEYSDGGTKVKTSCSWIAGKKFLERSFTTSENGKVVSSGKQIIGKDPLSQQITSWLFDSTGAHDQGLWTRQGQGWAIQSSGSTADGIPTVAVNQLKHVDDDTISWKSVNRMAGDQRLPDSAEVLLKRVK